MTRFCRGAAMTDEQRALFFRGLQAMPMPEQIEQVRELLRSDEAAGDTKEFHQWAIENKDAVFRHFGVDTRPLWRRLWERLTS